MAEAAAIDASRAPASLWDRAANWVSENKAVAYTIAGTVVVVTSAGCYYYYYSTQKPGPPSTPTEKRKSKKERRKEKKAAEEAAKSESGISLKDEEAGKTSHSSRKNHN